MRKREKKSHKLDKTGQLNHVLAKKASTIRSARQKQSNMSLHTITSSKKSMRVSRYSNVNIAMLNSMRSNETQQAEDLENTLSGQTKLEQRVSMLTIKRTMTCFFAIIFSVPFFISTTYKAYLSEFAPIAQMIDNVRMVESKTNYYSLLDFVVQNHKNDFDELVGLTAPGGYEWKSKDYANDEIRQLDLIEMTELEITFTVNLRKSVRLYSICGL